MEKLLSIIAIMIVIPSVAFPVIDHLGYLTDIDLENQPQNL